MNFNNPTPSQMLENWALRCSGKPLTDPTAISTGGRPGIDPELLMVIYVETTESFAWAREALSWTLIKGKPPEDFPLCRPGESRGPALFRRGWGMYLNIAPSRVCEAVVEAFTKKLEERMKDSPFFYPKQDDPDDE